MVVNLGGLLMLVGFVWMIYLVATNEATTAPKVIWGILIFLTGPIAGTVYVLVRRAGLIPVILMWIAVLFYGFGIFTSATEVINPLLG